MTDELTYEAYKALVESQCRAMLDTMAFVATGELDVEVEVPEGIEVLSELGIAFGFLVEDLRDIVQELRRSQADLEERVSARTAELQEALDRAQIIQGRYIREEWQAHAYQNDLSNLSAQSSAVLGEAIRKQQVTSQSLDEDQATLALPITYADEIIGGLSFTKAENTDWPDHDIEDIQVIVEQVGLTLENQRLFDQTQTALKEMEDQTNRLRSLGELGTALTQTTSMEEAIGVVGELISSVIVNDRASLALVEPDNETYQVFVLSGLVSHSPTGARERLSGTSIARAIETQSIIVNQDLRARNRDLDQDYENQHQGMRSNLIVPLMVIGKVVGTLNVGSKKPNAFTPDQRNRATQIATLLASTIENHRLLSQTQEALASAELLYLASHRILEAGGDLQEIVAAVVEAVPNPNIDRAQLLLFEYSINQQVIALVNAANWQAASAPPVTPIGTRYALSQIPMLELVLSSQPTFFSDIRQDERLDPDSLTVLLEQNIIALATFPLQVRDHQLGLLVLQANRPHQFVDTEIQPYISLSRQLAIAVDNNRLLEEAQHRARREQRLREVTARIRSSSDINAILQIAAKEIGDALGQKTVVSLNDHHFAQPNAGQPMTPDDVGDSTHEIS